MNPIAAEIVITGAALVCPLGLDKETVWAAVSQGRSGVGPLTVMESNSAGAPGITGGQAPCLPEGEAKGLPREVAYLRRVMRAALKEAGGLDKLPYAPSRCGVALGTTLHGMRQAGQYLRSGDLNAMRAFLPADVLRMASEGLALEGWGGTVCSACSSGLVSIVQAATLLGAGEAELMLAGGYDPMSEYAYAGFNSLRLIAPGQPRPFCVDRQGMKISEGYAVLVLERAADAQRRGAVPLARVAGWGETSDAFHLTKPHAEGAGAAQAMQAALNRAALAPSEISFISAHATGTPDNDGAEAAAMRTVFGPALKQTPVATFKSALGHTLGAAGAVELILSLMALGRQCVPAGVAGSGGNPEFPELQLQRDKPRAQAIAYTMTNSLGFGGANTSVVLGQAGGAGIAAHSRGQSGTASDRRESAVSEIARQAQSINEHQNIENLRSSRGFQHTGRHEDTADSRWSLAVPLGDKGGPAPASAPAPGDREVCITGIGVVMPGLLGYDNFARRIQGSTSGSGWSPLTGDTGNISDEELEPWLNARRVRRMSSYAKLMMAATSLACRDAGMGESSLRGQACGAVLGSSHGACGYCETYYRQIINEGIAAANPMLFAEGVSNAAAAHLSVWLEITGPCQAIIGSRTAGLEALQLAALRIRTGEWDRAIVGAGDEYWPLANQCYAQCGLYSGRAGAPFGASTGFATGCGAVVLVLESRAAARSRNAAVKGVFMAGAAARAGHAGDARAAIGLTADVLRRMGSPKTVIASANATVIDRLELAALRQNAREHNAQLSVSALYGYVAECFSVMPLAAIAAVLLTGRAPALAGELPRLNGAGQETVLPARGSEQIQDFGVLCSDYAGSVAGVRIACRR